MFNGDAAGLPTVANSVTVTKAFAKVGNPY